MSRKFAEDKLLIATSNPKKYNEMVDYLKDFPFTLQSLEGLNFAPPEENADSFRGNAELKARYYSQKTNMPVISDDSGLCIEALNGMPGIYSARWAAEVGGFQKAFVKIQEELVRAGCMDAKPKANFTCAMTLCWPDGYMFTCEGIAWGILDFSTSSTQGFGYDPIFIPAGYDQTFAQMGFAGKRLCSHRTKAFKLLISSCFI